jgi:hypothetical protein
MKRYIWIVVVLVTATEPALAAQTVYLKEGGTITAKSVWRTKGQVHVLVNRDTLTKFPISEIDLKRTFPHRRRDTTRPPPSRSTPSATVAAVPVDDRKERNGASRISLPKLPTLERNPENLVPTSGSGGTIRQHKKNMAEQNGE